MIRILLATTALLVTTQAMAAPLIQVQKGNLGEFSVANDDVLTGLIPVLDGPELFGSKVGALNDGTAYNGSSAFTTNESFVTTAGSTVTYTLATSGPGVDIASIVALTGYEQRIAQRFTVEYAAVGDAVFHELVSLTGDESSAYAAQVGEVRLSISSDTAAPLATGVGALRFTFFSNPDETVYREIDVFAVPEPNALGLMVMATLGLVRLRKRRMGG